MAVTDSQANAAAGRSELLIQQRLQEMKTTLTRMHTLLKQMQTKAADSHSKDSVAKANVEMWELMVGQLDKQFAELGEAARMRGDMEARRQAMYKQAEERSAATAQKAREGAPASTTAAGALTPSAATPAQSPKSASPEQQSSPSTSSPSPN
jgi:peptidoglycan hydrolase CwlO-like protein